MMQNPIGIVDDLYCVADHAVGSFPQQHVCWPRNSPHHCRTSRPSGDVTLANRRYGGLPATISLRQERAEGLTSKQTTDVQTYALYMVLVAGTNCEIAKVRSQIQFHWPPPCRRGFVRGDSDRSCRRCIDDQPCEIVQVMSQVGGGYDPAIDCAKKQGMNLPTK